MDERERIARDLHDNLFQNIQGLLLAIDNSTNVLAEGDPTRGTPKKLLQHSDQVMAESRE
jgi:signal transduction histidine kinase